MYRTLVQMCILLSTHRIQHQLHPYLFEAYYYTINTWRWRNYLHPLNLPLLRPSNYYQTLGCQLDEHLGFQETCGWLQAWKCILLILFALALVSSELSFSVFVINRHFAFVRYAGQGDQGLLSRPLWSVSLETIPARASPQLLPP